MASMVASRLRHTSKIDIAPRSHRSVWQQIRKPNSAKRGRRLACPRGIPGGCRASRLSTGQPTSQPNSVFWQQGTPLCLARIWGACIAEGLDLDSC